MTIGQRIAEARALAGLNQSQLAKRLGLRPQSIQQWELDKTTPRPKRLDEIAKVLSVSPEWLLFGHGSSKGSPEAKPTGSNAEVVTSYAVSDVVSIPLFDVELAAGVGTHIDMDRVAEHVSVGREILDQHNVTQDQVVAAKVKGDSMSPRLLDGDTILIDTSDKRPRDGQVYAIAVEDELKVKRLIRKMDGSWIVSSDNKDPAYRDEIISLANFERLRVIGRVFMIMMGGI